MAVRSFGILFATPLAMTLAKQIAADLADILQSRSIGARAWAPTNARWARVYITDEDWSESFVAISAKGEVKPYTGPFAEEVAAAAAEALQPVSEWEVPSTGFSNVRLGKLMQLARGLAESCRRQGYNSPAFHFERVWTSCRDARTSDVELRWALSVNALDAWRIGSILLERARRACA